MIVERMTPAERLQEAARLFDRAHMVCLHNARPAIKTRKMAKKFPAIVPPLVHNNKTDGEYTILEIYQTEELAKARLTSPHVIKQMKNWTTRPMLVIQSLVNDRMIVFEVTPHAMQRFRERAKQQDATRMDIATVLCIDIFNYAIQVNGRMLKHMKRLPEAVIKQATNHITPGWEVAVQGSHYGIWLCESACNGHYLRVNSFVDNDELFRAQHIARENGKSYFDFLRLIFPMSVRKEMAEEDLIKTLQKKLY